MMAGCVLCGAKPGESGVRLDVTFAAGRLGPRAFAEVPHRVRGWELCWDCCRANPLLMAVLGGDEDGNSYLEPVVELRGQGCRVECTGHRRGRAARFWSPFRGHRGVPEVGRCPVCWGPIEIPEAA